MKKLLFVICILIFGCRENPNNAYNNPIPKFSIGEIVYMKPDSMKAVIIYGREYSGEYFYAVRFTNKAGIVQETDLGHRGMYLMSEKEFY